jgi:hypothetical protein
MARPSPLYSAQPDCISVCGKMLKRGQVISVPASAIGPRERRMEAKGKILIRKPTSDGKVQIVCTLK